MVLKHIDADTYCHVIGASKSTILHRIQNRNIEDALHPTTYDKDKWSKITTDVNLAKIYEETILLFDAYGAKLAIWWSEHGFNRVKRYSLRMLMDGGDLNEHIYECPSSHLMSLIKYQDINFGENFTKIGRKRSASILPIIGLINQNDDVLDVGSAMGATLFSAGAVTYGHVLGIEPMDERYVASKHLKDYFGLHVGLENNSFTGSANKQFQHVVCLNVLHHILDFVTFTKLLCEAAEKTLVIELPSINDNVFSDTLNIPIFGMGKKQPLIGVSEIEADQTFVFNPSAVIRLISHDTNRKFDYDLIRSPLQGRYILFIYFEKSVPVRENLMLKLLPIPQRRLRNNNLIRWIYSRLIKKKA